MRSLSVVPALVVGLSVLLWLSAARAEDTKPIVDFEEDAQVQFWQYSQGQGARSTEHATSGKSALKMQTGAYVTTGRMPRDWSGFDSLNIDVYVEGDEPVGVSLLIADKPWEDKGRNYWDRHNGSYNLQPGANTIEIPVNGLFRGEAGSRNNNIKSNIDPTQIIRMDLGFIAKGKPAAIYLDNMRLVKESRPAGVLAFDFGPESQTVYPGFTPISWNTVYGQGGAKAGLSRARSHQNRARDDTYPTRLYQDFIEMGENNGEFICDLPNGDYRVWVVYDDCGYWGGETCRHKRRSIDAEGREVYVDDRGDNGPCDYLFRYEDIEPLPGASLWDLYVKKLFAPVTFKTTVADGKLNLVFHADAAWSSKVAAVVVYSEAVQAEAQKWVADVEARNRKEFETRAAFMGPKSETLTPPAEAQARGCWVGFPALEETVNVTGAPGATQGTLRRAAARGQRVSYTFAVRPLKDFGGAEAAATVSALTGPGGEIPAAAVDVRYVQYATKRGFNNIAYTIAPESLRQLSGAKLKLPADVTRQFWLTVAVPPAAKPGVYAGTVTLKAGELTVTLPLQTEVLDLTLDEPDFDMTFFGLDVPAGLPPARRETALREVMQLLKDNGMNTLSGGPSVPFSGLDAAGNPKLDFSASDAYFKTAREVGFTRTMHAYGGPGMVSGLQDGYVIGSTGRNWEKQTGKSFGELLKTVWGAVEAHAKANDWPKVAYYMCDEPRTEDSVKELLESMRAYKENVPNVYIGGGYSVHWGEQPIDKGIQEIFQVLPFSNLNVHGQKEMDQAKRQDTDIYIYNQGTDRYSFGQYQWAEYRKGVKGRIQWHLLALHGYQFYDLDGREPDTAMLNWGKNEIIPTIHLARCREGADDFRYAATLYNLAQKKVGSAAAQAALDYLESVNRAIAMGMRKRPETIDSDETFRAKCIEFIGKLK